MCVCVFLLFFCFHSNLSGRPRSRHWLTSTSSCLNRVSSLSFPFQSQEFKPSAFHSIRGGQVSVDPDKYIWIQEAIFKLYLFEDCETRAHLEKIFDKIFVASHPLKDRVLGLLTFFQESGEQGRNGFARYLHHQAK